jgi:hypothetical protein
MSEHESSVSEDASSEMYVCETRVVQTPRDEDYASPDMFACETQTPVPCQPTSRVEIDVTGWPPAIVKAMEVRGGVLSCNA